MRCLALAQAWNALNGRTVFAMAEKTASIEARLSDSGVSLTLLTEPAGSLREAAETANLANREGARWIVADGYHFTPEYQAALSQGPARLLCLDDEARGVRYESDVVLNQNVFADEALYGERARSSRLLLGPEYALLRRQFSEMARPVRQTPAVARKLLVTLGAADFDNVTLTVIHALQQLDAETFEATIVVGGSNPHLESLERALNQGPASIRLVRDAQNMPELMAWADFAIGAAGSTTLEFAFMGVPMILLVLADNQAPVADRMQTLGAARSLGSAASAQEIARAIRQLAPAAEERAAMSATAQRLVDGRGARRVALFLKASLLHLRPVTAADAPLLFEWVNELEIRAASFNSQPIPWEDHERWLTRKLASVDAVMLIAETTEGEPAGVVRFEVAEQLATISIAIAARFRGQGYGQQLIEESSRRILQRPDVRCVRALVKPSNAASHRAFLAAGFREDAAARTDDMLTYLFSSSPA